MVIKSTVWIVLLIVLKIITYTHACTGDLDCTPDFPYCSVGTCYECLSSSDCSNSFLCYSGTCYQCLSATDCTSSSSAVCLNNECIACSSDSQCKANTAANGDYCLNDVCVVCSVATEKTDCSGNTPFCDSTGSCASCSSSSVTSSCVSPTSMCLSKGSCGECVLSSDCSSTTSPICENNVCVACSSNTDCENKDSGFPKCKSDGSCQECLADADCTDQCNTNTNVCVKCFPSGQNTYCISLGATTPICAASYASCVACDDSNPCSSGSHCVNANSVISNSLISNIGACVGCTQSTPHCSGTKPVCSSANTCVACTTDDMCTGSGDSDNAVTSGLIALAYCQTATGANQGACVECTSHSHCSGKTPICLQYKCSPCTGTLCRLLGGFLSGYPVCATNTAVQSSLGSCFECTNANCLANFGSATPVCSSDADGTCVQCNSLSQANDCQYSSNPKTTTPICVSHTCTACSSNNQCASLNPQTPVCNSGPCVQCLQNSDCSTNFPSYPYCNTVTKTCVVCLNTPANINLGCSGNTPICDTTKLPFFACRPCQAPNPSTYPSTDCSNPTAYCAINGINQGKCVSCTDSTIHCIGSKHLTTTPVCSLNNICVPCSVINTCPLSAPKCHLGHSFNKYLPQGSCLRCDKGKDKNCEFYSNNHHHHHHHEKSTTIFVPNNYWSLSNDYTDSKGGASYTLTAGSNSVKFVADRFCTKSSALYLPKATLSFPAGTYFNGDFTLSFWMNLQSYQDSAGLIYFATSNAGSADTNQIGINMVGTTGQLSACIYSPTASTSSGTFNIGTDNLITLHKWYFVTFILKGTTGYIYLNGVVSQKGLLDVPANVIRNQNFIGKAINCQGCNSANYADVIMDEIKIYSGAMESQQVMNEYKLSKKGPSVSKLNNFNSENECRRVKPTNYWPLNNDGKDIVGSGSSISCIPGSCTGTTSSCNSGSCTGSNGCNCYPDYDRFGNPNSAVNFLSSSYSLPPGIYFNTNFTVTAWIYLYQAQAILIDFSNDDELDTTMLEVNSGNQLEERFYSESIGAGSSLFTKISAPKSTALNLNTWYHVAFIGSDNGYLRIYLNGLLVSKYKGNYPSKISTGLNYFGGNSQKATYDDIKIFNTALKPCQIMNEYVISNNPYLTCRNQLL